MLAIFGKYVATCPDSVKGPDTYSTSAMKDGSLANYFCSVYHHSVVADIDSSVVFAYSVEKPDHLNRTMFGVVDDVFCMYQGKMKDVDSLKKRYCLNDTGTETNILIEIFKIFREVKQEAPKRIMLDMLGNFSFIIYDRLSKCVMVTSDFSEQFPLFWGVDSEKSLVLSDEADMVATACTTTTEMFPKGEVYISCRGRSGIKAIFMDYTREEEKKFQLAQSDLDHRIEQLKKTGSPLLSTEKSWQLPPSPDVFKINTKGLVFSKGNIIGIGVTIRNSRGQIYMALSKKIKGFKRSIHAEELAIVEGLRMANMDGLRHVLCETACLELLWTEPHGAYYALLRSVRDALVNAFNSSSVLVIHRDANKAAHSLAEYAKQIEDRRVWHQETPPCISHILVMDSNPRASGNQFPAVDGSSNHDEGGWFLTHGKMVEDYLYKRMLFPSHEINKKTTTTLSFSIFREFDV